MTSHEQEGWYKEIELMIFTGSIYSSLSDENKALFNIIVKIIKKFEKVTPRFISDEFGLKASIAEGILNILTDELKILEKKVEKNEVIYINSPNLDDLPKENYDQIMTITVASHFSLAKFPFIFLDRPFKIETVESSADIDDIHQLLETCDEYMKTDASKRRFNIPSRYQGLDMAHGIKRVGLKSGKLVEEAEEYVLKIDDKTVARIGKSHPEHGKISSELNMIREDKARLSQLIEESITKRIEHVRFSINHVQDASEIEIMIYEKELGALDNILPFYQACNARGFVFNLKNGWFYDKRVKVLFSDPAMQRWITLLDGLLTTIEKEPARFFSQTKQEFLSTVHGIQNSITQPGSRANDLEFRKVIEMACKQKITDRKWGWTHLIYAKLIEDEIFE